MITEPGSPVDGTLWAGGVNRWPSAAGIGAVVLVAVRGPLSHVDPAAP